MNHMLYRSCLSQLVKELIAAARCLVGLIPEHQEYKMVEDARG